MKKVKKHFFVALAATLFLMISSIPEDLYFNTTIFESILFGMIIGLISYLTDRKL